jgi:hypothetical protein
MVAILRVHMATDDRDEAQNLSIPMPALIKWRVMLISSSIFNGLQI